MKFTNTQSQGCKVLLSNTEFQSGNQIAAYKYKVYFASSWLSHHHLLGVAVGILALGLKHAVISAPPADY